MFLSKLSYYNIFVKFKQLKFKGKTNLVKSTPRGLITAVTWPVIKGRIRVTSVMVVIGCSRVLYRAFRVSHGMLLRVMGSITAVTRLVINTECASRVITPLVTGMTEHPR